MSDRDDPPLVALALLAHLRRARDHIDRDYREPLDLDRLAAVAAVSKYHFVRSFDATYGETPIRYLTRRRIERAQDLLRSANLTVTEVCMPGCYLFMKGVLDPAGTTGRWAPQFRRSPAGSAWPSTTAARPTRSCPPRA